MKAFSILTTFALVLGLAACNGGGGRRTSGSQCPDGEFKPVPMDIQPNQIKLSLKAEDKQIPPGVYTYQGATIYYEDKSSLRILAKDVQQKAQEFKASVFCIRNAKAKLNPVAVDAIRSMDVTTGNKVIADVTTYSLGIENTKFKAQSVKNQSKKVESPSLVFDAAKFGQGDYFLLKSKTDDVNFEIRAKGADANGRFFVSIRLKKGPPRE